MRVEVGSKRAEALDGAHRAGPYVIAPEKLLEALSDALLSGLGEKREQGPFALEEAAEGLWDREQVMTMRHGLQDLFPELLGKTPFLDRLQSLGFRLASHTRLAVIQLAGE